MIEAPTPFEINNNSDIKPMKLLNEYSKSENQKEFNIKIGILDNCIKIIIKEGKNALNNYNGEFNLKDLQSIDKYFKMFDTIDDAYKELLLSFNENQYNIKIQEYNLILNLEIEYNHKKNIIPLILQKSEIKDGEIIRSLYKLANDYIKENNAFKKEINNLNTRIIKIEENMNSMNNKIDIILNYINDKKNKEKNFEKELKKSKIIENERQISLLKSWLPFQNKNNLQCKLIYDAKRDGDKASTFHSLCNNKPSTLTIISTSDNKIIGGFLSKPFGGNKGFISDNNAFLFSLNYNEKYPSLNKGNNYYDTEGYGPIFGNTCIQIEDKYLSHNKNYYEPFTKRYDFGNRHNEEDHYFKVIDLEIYQIFY
jgi:hypothetical protein